jgi:hypothetical protein
MNDLYMLIRQIRKAPSMYLGQNSILCLQAFLSGYSVAQYELGATLTANDEDFQQFGEWIRTRFQVQTSQSWANIILFYAEDERSALERFFDLFEEFVARHQVVDAENETATQQSPQELERKTA